MKKQPVINKNSKKEELTEEQKRAVKKQEIAQKFEQAKRIQIELKREKENNLEREK